MRCKAVECKSEVGSRKSDGRVVGWSGGRGGRYGWSGVTVVALVPGWCEDEA